MEVLPAQGQPQCYWLWMVELVGAAGGRAAVQPERWAEAGAQQRQLRVWPGRQVLEEEDRKAEVLKGQDRWEEDLSVMRQEINRSSSCNV